MAESVFAQISCLHRAVLPALKSEPASDGIAGFAFFLVAGGLLMFGRLRRLLIYILKFTALPFFLTWCYRKAGRICQAHCSSQR